MVYSKLTLLHRWAIVYLCFFLFPPHFGVLPLGNVIWPGTLAYVNVTISQEVHLLPWFYLNVYFPNHGSNPRPLHWKRRVLTTRPPRSSVYILMNFPSVNTPMSLKPKWKLKHLLLWASWCYFTAPPPPYPFGDNHGPDFWLESLPCLSVFIKQNSAVFALASDSFHSIFGKLISL